MSTDGNQFGPMDPTLIGTPVQAVGQRVGPYRLLEQLGEGGFGEVWLAEQTEPVRRKVALKLVKPGMDSRAVLARFEAERQALALMDHPGIARVYDAGLTPLGRPYFAMELARGVAITTYCDQKQLPTRERLELFCAVCRAIQHAHTKGLIHRDIKPSNILVVETPEGPVPKVIDFGIAKATTATLTEQTLVTHAGQLVGTPEYMSPEQAEGAIDIDARTDIFSLGVVLYELLTCSLPINPDSLRSPDHDNIKRAIREVDPPRPSSRLGESRDGWTAIARNHQSDPKTLRRRLRGDLDWVVLKALEKDRSRRYETASAFEQDIERHLTDQPVLARRASRAYTVRKFIKRNKGLASAGGALGLALVIAMGALVWAFTNTRAFNRELAGLNEDLQSAVAERTAEANRARRAEADLKAINEDLLATQAQLESMNEQLSQEIARARAAEAEALRQEEAARVAQSALGRMLTELAPSQGSTPVLSYRNALQQVGEMLDRPEQQAGGAETVNASVRMQLARAAYSVGDFRTATINGESALALRIETLGETNPETLDAMRFVGDCYQRLGLADASERVLARLVELQERALPPGDARRLEALGALALTIEQAGDDDRAIEPRRRVLQLRQEHAPSEHEAILTDRIELARLLVERDRRGEALDLLTLTLREAETRQLDSAWQADAARCLLGLVWLEFGDRQRALDLIIEPAARLTTTDTVPDRWQREGFLAVARLSAGAIQIETP